MKKAVGISEIVLWAAHKERSLHFYRDLLGLDVISPPTLPYSFLKVGGGHAGIPQMIVLVPKSDEVKARPSGYQLHHMALELPEEDFDAQHAAHRSPLPAALRPCDAVDSRMASLSPHPILAPAQSSAEYRHYPRPPSKSYWLASEAKS